MNERAVKRFGRYLVIGVFTFLLDLGLLFAGVQFLGIPYYIATPVAFLIAVSVNYHFSRRHVFHQTDRKYHHGLAYYWIVALVGAAATTTLVTFLVATFGLYYLTARIITAGLVGMGNYLFNLHFNFKVAGKH